MDAYTLSIIIVFLGIIVATPLYIIKGFNKYSLILFLIIISFASITRPFIEGVDNQNLINALKEQELNQEFSIKMSLIYYLSYLIPGGWQKLLAINIFSTSLLVFSFNRILNNFKKAQVNNSLILLYISYIFFIIPPLLIIHLKQYLGVAFLSLLIANISNKKKYSLSLDIFLSCLVILSHIVYFPFILYFFISKYQLNNIKKVDNRSKNSFKILILISIFTITILTYLFIDKGYIFLSSILQDYEAYGIQINLIERSGINILITVLYPFIILIPIILYKLFGKTKFKNNFFNYMLFLYLLFIFPISILEYKLSFLYAIGRVKTSMYPALLLLIYGLKDYQIKKMYSIPISVLSLGLTTIVFFKTINSIYSNDSFLITYYF